MTIANRFFSLLALLAPLAGCDADAHGRAQNDVEEAVTLRDYYPCADYVNQIPTVNFGKELLITATSVVDDNCRTNWNLPGCAAKAGKWTAWGLFKQFAGGGDPSPLILAWFKTFYNQDQVNGWTLSKRDNVKAVVLGWRKASGCNAVLDDPCVLLPEKSPFRLLAIVNRMDVRSGEGGFDEYGQPSPDSAGEGRMVFGFLGFDPNKPNDPPNTPLLATVIFEFKLRTDLLFVGDWAWYWRSLGGLNGEQYNAQLQSLTELFATAATLNQVRTNEIDFDIAPLPSRRWSMREFKLGCPINQPNCLQSQKRLLPVTVTQTPDSSINADLTKLGAYLNGVDDDILLGQHVVPPTFQGQKFLGAESLAGKKLSHPGGVLWGVDKDTFDIVALDGSSPKNIRHMYGFSTCIGCHYNETKTQDLFITNRAKGQVSTLAPFLTTDPVAGNYGVDIEPFEGDPEWHFDFNEPRRRVCELLHAEAGNPFPLTMNTGRPH